MYTTYNLGKERQLHSSLRLSDNEDRMDWVCCYCCCCRLLLIRKYGRQRHKYLTFDQFVELINYIAVILSNQ